MVIPPLPWTACFRFCNPNIQSKPSLEQLEDISSYHLLFERRDCPHFASLPQVVVECDKVHLSLFISRVNNPSSPSHSQELHQLCLSLDTLQEPSKSFPQRGARNEPPSVCFNSEILCYIGMLFLTFSYTFCGLVK